MAVLRKPFHTLGTALSFWVSSTLSYVSLLQPSRLLDARSSCLEKRSQLGDLCAAVVIAPPDIFLIIFAAVVTRSTGLIATYLLARGIKLMTLEQLLRNTSISNAFMTQIALRRLTPTGLGLLLLWAVSHKEGSHRCDSSLLVIRTS